MTAELAEAYLRLAWQADRDGRPSMRDALLTLAAAAGHRLGSPWVGRCRRALIAARSAHLFAAFPTVEAALADPRVGQRLARLGRTFPPARVRHLLLASAARRGPYTGRVDSLRVVLDDLFGEDGAGTDELTRAYLRILLELAILLDSAIRPTQRDARGRLMCVISTWTMLSRILVGCVKRTGCPNRRRIGAFHAPYKRRKDPRPRAQE